MTEPEKQAPGQVEQGRRTKVEPESVELRSPPARAIRFRRGAIIGVAALGTVSLATIALTALKPHLSSRVIQESELSQPATQLASESLAGTPSSYGDAPKLGPPLPGDLGRPFLRAHERSKLDPASTPIDHARANREQRLAELKAARESGVLVQTGGGPEAPPSLSAAVPMSAPDVTDPSNEASATRKERFSNVRDDKADLNAHGLLAPLSPNTLIAGSVIAASLITGLNSDLPGMVTAQVTQNVYDTVTGHILLVPQGARLIGKYDSVVAFGQKRALVIWQRLILPNGSSVRLDNMPATDAAGYAGLADKVDFHTWSLLKGVAIATMLGVGSELTVNGGSDLVQAIREAAQTNMSRSGDQIAQRNLDVQPTITIRPGATVRLLVTRDLVITPDQDRSTTMLN